MYNDTRFVFYPYRCDRSGPFSDSTRRLKTARRQCPWISTKRFSRQVRQEHAKTFSNRLRSIATKAISILSLPVKIIRGCDIASSLVLVYANFELKVGYSTVTVPQALWAWRLRRVKAKEEARPREKRRRQRSKRSKTLRVKREAPQRRKE